MNVAIVGCGDIGIRCASILRDNGHEILAIRRRISVLPDWLPAKSADVEDPQSLSFLGNIDVDVVLYILSAAEFNERAYRLAYVEGVANTIAALGESVSTLRRFIFVSSTSVYHQNDGSSVNEETRVAPLRFNGKLMLEGEALVGQTGVGTSVRFSGIYGPDRLRMINRVAAGQGGKADPSALSNRIHVDDCAGVLSHLVQMSEVDSSLDEVYLASDSYPATTAEVEQFIATTLGLTLQPQTPFKTEGPQRIAGSKRCDNTRLLGTGYGFLHPDFRSGYREIIAGLRSPNCR